MPCRVRLSSHNAVCLSWLWSSLCWKNKTCTCPGRGSRSAAKPFRLWSACVWGAFMNWGIMELNSVVAAQWTVGRWKVDFGSNWGRLRTQRENWGPDAVSVLTGLSPSSVSRCVWCSSVNLLFTALYSSVNGQLLLFLIPKTSHVHLHSM